MAIKNIILIVIAVINLALGFYIYSKNWRSWLRLAFFSLAVALALWCLSNSLALHYSYLGQEAAAVFWLRGAFLMAALIALTFVCVGYLFPLGFKPSWPMTVLACLPFVALTATIFFEPDFIIRHFSLTIWPQQTFYNPWGYLIFNFYFLLYVGWGCFFLIKRYLAFDGIIRRNSRLLLIGFVWQAVFAIVFDLLLPLGGCWQLIWCGPYLTLGLVGSVAYMVFY